MKFNEKLVIYTPYGVIKWVQDILKQSELEDKDGLFQKDDKNVYVDRTRV